MRTFMSLTRSKILSLVKKSGCTVKNGCGKLEGIWCFYSLLALKSEAFRATSKPIS